LYYNLTIFKTIKQRREKTDVKLFPRVGVKLIFCDKPRQIKAEGAASQFTVEFLEIKQIFPFLKKGLTFFPARANKDTSNIDSSKSAIKQ